MSSKGKDGRTVWFMIYVDFISAKITFAKKYYIQITKRDIADFVIELKRLGKLSPTIENIKSLPFTNLTQITILIIPKNMFRD